MPVGRGTHRLCLMLLDDAALFKAEEVEASDVIADDDGSNHYDCDSRNNQDNLSNRMHPISIS